jgi:osmotically-inducible protein OsmY
VKNGNISLEGVIDNKLEMAQVEAAARSVPGTFAVKNNLRIERES